MDEGEADRKADAVHKPERMYQIRYFTPNYEYKNKVENKLSIRCVSDVIRILFRQFILNIC